MRKSYVLALALVAILAAAPWSPARGAYPEKPIEFIIPFGAGDSADIEGRLLAKEMAKILGQPLVPINKVGAGGAITYTYVKNAKPDGYTVAWNSTSLLVTTNIGNVDYDYKAFDHIGRVEVQPMPFAVRADARWKTFREFIADCKRSPRALKVANAGIGSSTHLVAVALADAAGCEVIHLPVGVARRNAALLGGEVDAMVYPLTGGVALERAGKIRTLVVPSAQREPSLSNVPTARELGYEAEVEFFRGLSVPKGTPAEVKAKLADAMIRATRSPAFTGLAEKMGFRVAPLGPGEFEAYLARQDEITKAVMKRAGVYQSERKR